MKTAIIGGGAAGFFLAVNLKEMMPEMEVTIFEKSKRVLAKVEISGGGRCNCTNSFAHVRDLSAVYPRGHRLMKRLMKGFSQEDAYEWFERHGVRLTTQDDQCVFPLSQDSHTIKVPYAQTTLTFEAYVTQGSDELDAMMDSQNRWGELSFNFIAMSPQRTPT